MTLKFLNIVLKLYFTLPFNLATSYKHINHSSRPLYMIYIPLKFLKNHEISACYQNIYRYLLLHVWQQNIDLSANDLFL